MAKRDLTYLRHILACILKIASYIEGMEEIDFKKDDKTQDACIRQLEILGEATKRLSDGLRQQYTSIPWKQMAGMRDVLIHDYLHVDLTVVWTTITADIPSLKSLIEELIAELEE